jgi:cell wall-associated NlpC family hydrolase
MPTLAQAAAEALKWVNTPFRDKGRTIGSGVDCVGVPICVGMALGIAEAFEANQERSYPRVPNGWRLRDQLDRFMDRLPSKHDAKPGDVLLIAWRRYPLHVAMRAPDRGSFRYVVHATEEIGKVAHHILNQEWEDRVILAYRYRGLT